jgi:hypothetical protein
MPGRAIAVAVFALTSLAYAGGLVLRVLAGEPFTLNEALIPVLYTFSTVGFLIALNRPGNAIAWICLGIGAVWGLETAGFGLVTFGQANPGSVPRPDVIAAVVSPLWIPGIFTIGTFLLLLFPDGRLPSPRWRWLAWVAGLVILTLYPLMVLSERETFSYGRPAIENPLANVLGPWVEEGGLLATSLELAILLSLLTAATGSILAVVLRYRRSKGEERQQLKWLATAGTVSVVVFTVAIFMADVFGDTVGLVAAFAFVLIPVSIGIAVLRHGLYHIDRLVSRTVTYAVVIILLATAYALTALTLGTFVGQNNPVAVAGATLTAAALFNPVRRRVHTRVDRQFNRARYDAQLELEAFAKRLGGNFDIDVVTRDLMGVVSRTVRPSAATTWVKGRD